MLLAFKHNGKKKQEAEILIKAANLTSVRLKTPTLLVPYGARTPGASIKPVRASSSGLRSPSAHLPRSLVPASRSHASWKTALLKKH